MATPIVPWSGGKWRLVDILIPRLPPNSCYGEVFAEAAVILYGRWPVSKR
jgi:DNA adenine methylase